MSISSTKWHKRFLKFAGGSALLTGLATGALSLPSAATPVCGDDWDETPCMKQAEGDVERAYNACGDNAACQGWADGDFRRDRIQRCHDEKRKEQNKIDACWAKLSAASPKYSHTCQCTDPTGKPYAYGADSCSGCCPGTQFNGCTTH